MLVEALVLKAMKIRGVLHVVSYRKSFSSLKSQCIGKKDEMKFCLENFIYTPLSNLCKNSINLPFKVWFGFFF